MALSILACKKKQNTTLGTDVQPESDALNTEISDTATIQTHTIKHPDTKSYQDQFKYIGANQDPAFGRTNANIFTNFSIPNGISNISFGEENGRLLLWWSWWRPFRVCRVPFTCCCAPTHKQHNYWLMDNYSTTARVVVVVVLPRYFDRVRVPYPPHIRPIPKVPSSWWQCGDFCFRIE